MEQPIRFIGMDVHKDTIVVAVTAAGDSGRATPYGTFPNTVSALEKLVKRLRQPGSGPLKFCYEAGPCGYGVHRTLTRFGEDCMVVAPSMIPRKSGDRQKNDKRDAASLAVLHRGGLLTAVWVPDAAHEAMRDLIRARLAAVRAVRTARQQLSAFLLRHERTYRIGGKAWTRRIEDGLPPRVLLSQRNRSCWRKVLKRCAWVNNGGIVLTAICARRSRPGRCSRWCET
jgi:transposase